MKEEGTIEQSHRFYSPLKKHLFVSCDPHFLSSGGGGGVSKSGGVNLGERHEHVEIC